MVSYQRSIWRLRWDLFLTVVLAFALASGARWVADLSAAQRYEDYQAQHAAQAGAVGAAAPADLPRASTLAEMEALALFTMELDAVTYISNSPGGYIDGHFWNIFTLDDGARVAAKVNGDAVVHSGGTAILPVGELVVSPLTEEQLETLDQYGGVTVTDRYIDMEGGHSTVSAEDHRDGVGSVVWLAVFFPALLGLHPLGVKAGLFPPLLPRREKQES